MFTTNPPMEVEEGQPLLYSPAVSTTGLTAPDLTYVLVGLGGEPG